MINYLEGKLVEKYPTRIVVDVGGVGYNINIPLSTFDRLQTPGSQLRILTYLHVRKDCQQLYGFITGEEKHLFGLLLSISGIGPKLALTILSGGSVKEIKSAIANKSARILNNIPGVGKKTSERIIVELREKIGDMPELKTEAGDKQTLKQEIIFNDAVLALVSLGYKQLAAKQAVKKAASNVKVKEDTTPEKVIREALRVI
ncbi:MAG: Holliday junction branch migration protein RuvA [Candidatus Omnitrophota bacterium]|nr:Holliday junction branch migration protein RuvA [Candidatus Omnitrophota bacterium]